MLTTTRSSSCTTAPTDDPERQLMDAESTGPRTGLREVWIGGACGKPVGPDVVRGVPGRGAACGDGVSGGGRGGLAGQPDRRLGQPFIRRCLAGRYEQRPD